MPSQDMMLQLFRETRRFSAPIQFEKDGHSPWEEAVRLFNQVRMRNPWPRTDLRCTWGKQEQYPSTTRTINHGSRCPLTDHIDLASGEKESYDKQPTLP